MTNMFIRKVSAMEVTVLGRCGPFPAPGEACSGYLLKCGGKNIMLDFGSGVFSRLYGLLPRLDVDAVVLSHLHSDHMADMLIFRYALEQLSARSLCRQPPIPVIAPAEPREEYRLLSGSGVFDMTAIKDGAKLRYEGITFTFYRMTHPVESYAISVEYGGKRLLYTGDTGMRHDMVDIASGADMLLADVCYLNEELGTRPIAAHLSAAQAGNLAAAANVDILLCSHLWGGRTDHSELMRQVRAAFPKAVNSKATLFKGSLSSTTYLIAFVMLAFFMQVAVGIRRLFLIPSCGFIYLCLMLNVRQRCNVGSGG